MHVSIKKRQTININKFAYSFSASTFTVIIRLRLRPISVVEVILNLICMNIIYQTTTYIDIITFIFVEFLSFEIPIYNINRTNFGADAPNAKRMFIGSNKRFVILQFPIEIVFSTIAILFDFGSILPMNVYSSIIADDAALYRIWWVCVYVWSMQQMTTGECITHVMRDIY